ncbi:Dihydroneopterin aldolase/epimerase domain containing protein [Parasponia andersonii]|uniref:dihydroneopterin aldolase n=1 Tax=Parasponia andersonii TaxID=3476 RepID=A0A2P5A693_PARAD|nr:Dihydroneopterin aldolase/epimerase domain containing protein [Parasponia andersonii]
MTSVRYQPCSNSHCRPAPPRPAPIFSVGTASQPVWIESPPPWEPHLEPDSTGEVIEGDAIAKGDKVILRGLLLHGFHGVKPEERKLGQKFLVDFDAWLDLRFPGVSDRLSDTISYTDITSA